LKEIQLGGFQVNPGEKKSTFLNVSSKQPPESVQIPLTIINGSEEGPTLTVTAGVHGTEYAGIEAAIRIARETDPRKLRGTMVVVPAVNSPALYARVVGVCPLDSVELFRAFPGREDGSITYAITRKIFNDLVLNSNFAIDLHGGEMIESRANRCCWYVNAGNKATQTTSKDLAIAFGLPNILDASMVMVGTEEWAGPSGTMLYEASARNVPTIIGEAGGEGKIEEDLVGLLTTGVRNALVHVGMLRANRRQVRKKPAELKDLTGLVAETDGLFYSRVQTAQRVRKGKPIGEIKDILGERVQELIAPFDGLVHAQYVAPIARKGEPILWLVRKR
jgi:predicted deacylase